MYSDEDSPPHRRRTIPDSSDEEEDGGRGRRRRKPTGKPAAEAKRGRSAPTRDPVDSDEEPARRPATNRRRVVDSDDDVAPARAARRGRGSDVQDSDEEAPRPVARPPLDSSDDEVGSTGSLHDAPAVSDAPARPDNPMEQGEGRTRPKRRSSVPGGVNAEDSARRQFTELEVGPYQTDVQIRIDEEDMETSEPLRPNHVLDYVRGADPKDEGRVESAAAVTNLNTFYVESIATRQFKRFAGDIAEQQRQLAAQTAQYAQGLDSSSQRGKGDDGQPPVALSAPVTMWVRVVFFLSQGMLAGVGLATLIVSSVPETHAEFNLSYPGVAGAIRQLFYLFATLSWLGVVDRLMAERNHSLTSDERKQLNVGQTWFLVGCYSLVLVLGMVLTPIDNRMFGKPQDVSDGELLVWRVLAAARFVVSLMGWIVICLGAHHNSLVAEKAVKKHKQYELALVRSQAKYHRLNGKTLDRLSMDQLRELHEEQKAILEKTEAALQTARTLQHAGGTDRRTIDEDAQSLSAAGSAAGSVGGRSGRLSGAASVASRRSARRGRRERSRSPRSRSRSPRAGRR